MQSLSLPIRGQIERVNACGETLVLETRHLEGKALGLYRIALARLMKGELRGEEGLTSILTGRDVPITWSSVVDHVLWAIDREGALWSLGAEDKAFTLQTEFGQPVEHAVVCPQGIAWADAKGGIHLWRSEGEGWSWYLDSDSEHMDESQDEAPTVSAMYYGHQALIVGLSNGTMCLWNAQEGLPQGVPIEISAHQAPISALLSIEAEGKPYLLSYCEGLQLMQTRLDDLSPMSRAAKGKGLHTLPVSALIAGPLGRFYSLSRDGSLKAWQDAYSNVRPASHDDLGALVSGAFFECPIKNLDGDWPLKPALVLATQTEVKLYELISEPAEGEEAQQGRLGQLRYGLRTVESWIDLQLADREQSVRSTLLECVSAWDDAVALKTLSRIAAHDDDPKLRVKAVKTLLKSTHPQVIHTLEGLLNSEDDQVACAAFKGLRKAYGVDSLYPMKLALQKGKEAVSIEACSAYAERAELRDEAALVGLKEILKDARLDVAQSARLELERALNQLDATLYALNHATALEVKIASVQRMYRLGLIRHPRIQSRLQALREDQELTLREAALSATLLASPTLGQLLRAQDELLHEQLRKFEALDLKGEPRNHALKLDIPDLPSLETVSQSDRQILFELSACGSADIAIYGPVALAELGDLRALPILLALSRTPDQQVRLRATRGLSALAKQGERRALTPLKTLCHDEMSVVRLSAFAGLRDLLKDDVIHYVEVGLTASHSDVRLAAISAAQSLGLPSSDEGGWRVLRLGVVHQADLELAREARKVYLRDQVGGNAVGTHLLLLESAHEEIRRATLHDMVAALKAGRDLEALPSVQASGGGAGAVNGKSFLFTGTLSRLKRSEAQKKVTVLGGSNAAGVNASLDYLVLGDEGKAGSKLDKARKLGVRVLSETEFMDMIGEGVGGTAVGADAVSVPQEILEESVDTPRDPYAWIRLLGQALLADPSPDLRAEVRRSLLGEEEGKGALVGTLRLAVLKCAIESQYVDNRLGAISALNGVEDIRQAVELLSARLSDSSSEVSTAALKAALKLSDEAAEQLLSSGMSHENDGVRASALSAIISASKKTTWRSHLLWNALEDASEQIRAEAMDALHGDEAIEVAEKLLDAQHEDIRGRAALTLARYGDLRACSYVRSILSTPCPSVEEVQAKQEALDGGLGLLDERRWRREVTVALSAHQEAFAQANALASTRSEDQSTLSFAHATAAVRQSIHTLVHVQDQVEGAHTRAVTRWRNSIQSALNVAIEGEYQEVWEEIWALRDHEDQATRQASWKAWEAIAPFDAQLELENCLKDQERGPYAAWALARLGNLEGLLSMRGRGAKPIDLVRASHLVADQVWRDRIGSEAVITPGVSGVHTLYLEVLRLIVQGGESILLTAALSSDDPSLRRMAAGFIERAHDAKDLLEYWCEFMNERRPQEDRELEAQIEAFKAGTLKDKPKGTLPKWPSVHDWKILAHLVWHPHALVRARGASLLHALPSHREQAKEFLERLKRYASRYQITYSDQPVSMALSRDEARSLAFGTYTSLLSLSQDQQALQEMTRLIDVDPVGSLALLSVVLRGSASLRDASKRALHEHREALNLSELELAELLISTDVAHCVKEGAAMIAHLEENRAIELIRSDLKEAAKVAFEASLVHRPSTALALSLAALNSATSSLRADAVSRAMKILKAAEQLGWRAETEQRSEEIDPAQLSEEQGRRYGLSNLDITMIKGLSAGVTSAQIGDLVYEHLLAVLLPAQDEKPAFADVQLLIAEGLAQRQDEQAFDPLYRALQSDDPSLSNRGIQGLVNLKSTRSAPSILARLIHDPAQSLNHNRAFTALAQLRDPSIVAEFLTLLDHERFDADEVSQTVLKISGFDEKIDENAIWAEMSKEDREAEEKRAYQNTTLAQHLTASVRVGRFSDILYYDELIEAAKTARGPAPELDRSLVALFTLPRGEYEIDQVRREAVASYAWRAQHRQADPSPLCTLLTHRDDDTRWHAALGLALAQRNEGLDLLLQLAKDKVHGYSWRAQAVKALGVCADLRAVRALLRIYDDPEDYLREESLEALGHMGKSEVAQTIRARLIEGLYQANLGSIAIQGMRYMDHPETWETLRSAVRYARIDHGLQVEALKALSHDTSEDSLHLFEWLLTHAQGATRDRSYQVHLQAYQCWRARLGALPEVMNAVEAQAPKTLAPERALFKLSASGQPWEASVEALEHFADPQTWLELCFEVVDLSTKHQSVSARFESKLRQLDPAPLELLFDVLPRAAAEAPQIADMALTLIGSEATHLGKKEREKLLQVTAEVREAWCASRDEGLGAPIDLASTLGKRMNTQAQTWERLIWLWGKTSGGEAELWAALRTENLTVEIAREAILSISSCADRGEVELNEALLSCPVASIPEISAFMTRLIGSSEHLSQQALERMTADVALSVDTPSNRTSLWNALASGSQALSEALSTALTGATLHGDPLALDALVRGRYTSVAVTLLKTLAADQYDEDLTCAVVSGVAQLGNQEIEEALVKLAQGSKRPHVAQAAWRARRRSSKARARREA